jgi:uncharacterized protein YecE (DUF72 family)
MVLQLQLSSCYLELGGCGQRLQIMPRKKPNMTISTPSKPSAQAVIRVGMGGWSYKPWRETFYPPEVKAKDELYYASRQVTAIEINSTFYRLQKPTVFAKWRDSTPDDFVFCVKAPRFIVQRKVLAEGADSVARFIDSGIAELEHKLGALLWQLAPTHAFDARDLEAFLQALPTKVGSFPLKHALNVRHESFRNLEFIKLARNYNVAIVMEDDAKHPAIADVTADFIYARLRRTVSDQITGYSKPALKKWAERAHTWASGEAPDDLPRIDKTPQPKKPREIFIFFINGAKERAPAAAMQLIKYLADRKSG